MEIKKLEFKQKSKGEWSADSRIGRYFIDLSGGVFESYSDIEEIGADNTFEESVKKVQSRHEENIKNCMV